MPGEYDTIAPVYDWIVPDAVLSPQGSADAFLPALGDLPRGSRVLDCSAGTGTLAVGLAMAGFDVTATDASDGMVERIRGLAARHGVDVPARTARWEELGEQGFEPFDAVICVGNSLAHAPGAAARRSALTAMAGVLLRGGILALTSRNWEFVRARPLGLQTFDHVVVRDGRPGIVIYSWWLGEDWDDPHAFDIAVALIGDDGAVTTHRERLSFSPFRRETLDEDLRAAGLEPETTTWEPEVDRYLVTARRARSS
jgi:SAM-dependent methyltransferase